jgi:Uri superfamily endonuclease
MKILILSLPRSGSRYLTTLLYNYSPESTLLLVEPFNRDFFNTQNQKYISKVVKETMKNDNVILKTHLSQLTRQVKNKKHIDYFLNNKNWFRILLLRKDLFSCVLSYIVADALNNWGDKKYKTKSLLINENLFIEELKSKMNAWNEFAQIKIEGQYNKIIYFEDLSFNLEEDIKKINQNSFTEKQIKREFFKKTPYEKLSIINKDNLKNIFNTYVNSFTFNKVKNNNGFLELK